MAQVIFWVAILALTCSCVIPAARATLTEEEQAELLKAHNHYRGLVDPIATNMLRLVSAFVDDARILICCYIRTPAYCRTHIHARTSFFSAGMG